MAAYQLYKPSLSDHSPKDLRIDEAEVMTLYLRLSQHNLVFTLVVNDAPTKHIWRTVFARVKQQCNEHGLSVPKGPKLTSSANNTQELQDAVDFNNLPWQFYQFGTKPRVPSQGRLLRMRSTHHYDITSQMLAQKFVLMPDPTSSSSAGIIMIGILRLSEVSLSLTCHHYRSKTWKFAWHC